MNDKVKDLYDFLTNEGYDFMGSEDEFRGKLQDGAKAGELYSFLTNEGYDFMGTYDEFISKVGAPYNTAAANRAAGVDEASNRAKQAQQAQQPTQRNMGTPGVVPNRFGIPMQQQGGMGPVADAAPHPMTPAQMQGQQYVTQQGQGETYTPSARVKTPTAKRPKPMAPAPRAGQWSGAPMQQTPYAPTEEEGDLSFMPIEQGEDTKARYDAERRAVGGQGGQVQTMRRDIDSRLQEAYQRDLDNYGSELDKGGFWARMGRSVQAAEGNNPAANAVPSQLSDDTRDYQAAKHALDNSQKIIDEANAASRNGNFFAGAGRGMRDKFFDVSTWDFGITDLTDQAAIMRALEAYDKGEQLTESQQALLDAKAVELATTAYFGSELGRGYKAGQVTAEAIPFMFEMAINPAAGIGKGASKAMVRYALKKFGKEAIQKGGKRFAAKQAMKYGTRIVGDVVGASGMTATTGAARTAADALDRMAGNLHYDTDAQGNITFDGHTDAESWVKAFGKAFASTTIENYSEMLGNYFGPALGLLGKGASKVGKGIARTKAGAAVGRGIDKIGGAIETAYNSTLSKKIGLQAVGDFISKVPAGKVAGFLSELEKRAQWHGVMGEYAEEVAGGILNALVVGDQTLDTDKDTGVFNLDNNIDTFLGVALMGGFFSGARTVGYGAERAHNARQFNKANRMGAAAFGDGWANVQAAIESDPKAGAVAVLADPNSTKEQREAALRYAAAVTARQGMEQGKAKRDAEGIQTQQEAAAEQSYNTGYDDANTDELRSDINMAYTDARAKLVELIGDDAVNDIDSDPLAMQAQYDQDMTVDDNTKSAIADYVSAKSAWDGVQQRISDDAADRADQRRAEGEKMAYKGKGDMQGAIRPLTIKEESSEIDPQTGERKNKTVYLVNGNIAIEPNGNGLSREGTDKTIYVYDPETGEAHELDPFGGAGVLSVGDVVSMEDYLADNEQQSQAEVQQEIDNATGKVNVAPNTPFVTPEGRQGIVKSVEGDNVIVQFSDGEMEEASIPLADMQQYADALRRQEYEARHPQQTAAEQPQQPNTATEGQAPTAQAETPTEGGNTTDDTRTPAQRTYDDMQFKYGEKASHKVDVTLKDRKSTLDTKKKALDKAQADYDDAPIGKEDKAEAALAKAQEEYDTALADYNAWDEVRKLRDQALLAQAEQEEAARKAELERKRAAETEAQRKQREEYEADQARRKAEAEAAERRRQEENERLRQQEAEAAANPQPAEQPAPIEGTKGQASQLAIARQELADDPGALAMLEDMEPTSLEEVAAMLLTSGKGQVKLLRDDFMAHTGYSSEDVKRYPFIFAGKEKGGITLAKFGEKVIEEARDYNIPLDDNDAMIGVNAVLNMLSSVGRQSDINDYVAMNRIRMAYDYHNTALAAARANMLESYGMTEGEYESYMSWLEDAIEQGKSTLSDEEFNQLFNVYEQGQTTDVARGNQESTATTERTESAETDVSQNGERGNGETDAGTGEQAAVETEGVPAQGETPAAEQPRAAVGEGETPKEEKTSKLDEFLGEDADEYRRLQEQLKKALYGQLNMGLPPEAVTAGVKMTGLLIKHGVKKIAEVAKQLIETLGEAVRPYIKSFYAGAIFSPDFAEYKDGTSTLDEINAFDENNFDKARPAKPTSLVDYAKEIAAEQEIEKQVEQIKPVVVSLVASSLPEDRDLIDRPEKKPTKGNKKEDSTLSNTEQGQLDLFGSPSDTETETPSESNLKFTDEQRAKVSEWVKGDLLRGLDSGERPFKSVADIRKMAQRAGLDVDMDGRDDVALQEMVEDGLVRAARQIIERGGYGGSKSRTAYEAICQLYDLQPTISRRSDNRVKMQQYSTPLPMAFVADMFAWKPNSRTLEPTAGNGMLVFAIPAKNVVVNELDETRLANLRQQGFEMVLNEDATSAAFTPKAYDSVIANPPFGKAEAKSYDGKSIAGLDEQIALNALSAMKDNGKAAIIIGGNMEYGSNGAIKGNKAFWTYLYDHYNVKGVVDMAGKLYAKQGTTYPTRMILIDGRRSEEERAQSTIYPPRKHEAIRKAETFEDLYDIIGEVLNSNKKTNGNEVLRTSSSPVTADTDNAAGKPNAVSNGEQPNANADNGQNAGTRPTDSRGSGESNKPTEQRPTQTTARPSNGGTELTGNAGVSKPQGNYGGNAVRGGERGGSGRAGDTERVQHDGVRGNGNAASGVRLTEQRETEKRTLTEEKLSYRPHNSAFSLQSVAPAAMVEAMDKSLAEIESKWGNIDEFVTNELGYDSVEEMHNALAAEQVDSVAMAIFQMQQGKAMIIGDQTGVGKGRQMAALIRWACRHGKKPIFITQKDDLFTDLYRDLVDVGSGDLRPFIFNAATESKDKETGKKKYLGGVMLDADGNLVYKALGSAAQAKIFASGKLPDEYDFVVLTYSQVNTGDMISSEAGKGYAKESGNRSKKTNAEKNNKPTPKATFLRSIAQSNYLFLDESHTAAGDSNVGAYIRSIIGTYAGSQAGYAQGVNTGGVAGVTFASATFAKRPDTMPMYAMRTAMSEANVQPYELISIIARGGVTLQEIMSRALTESGQMVRRERDMSDVRTDWETIDNPELVQRARENYDKTIVAFNAIIKFQEDYVKPMIDALDAQLSLTASSADVKKGTNKMGVENVPFASKTYNYTKQLMLALKVDAIVDRVEQEIKAGRHPVIALESTMEASIKDYNAGDVIGEPTFSASLLRGLDNCMQYTVKDEDGKESHFRYDPRDLGPDGERAYYELQDFIRQSTSGVFISPLDAIIEKLHERGYKVGELTGRNSYVERDADGNVVVKKRTDKDKKRMQRDFNSGALDVLILNKSASTGISLHASEKFSDQRQRSMIIAQPLSDINDYMQMIGRIDRTGQVHRGYYINLGLPVPAESRFLMMLSTKLKSLNANTTTSQESESSNVEAPDLLNKYGSQVIVEYLRDNPDIYVKMGEPLKKSMGQMLKANELDNYEAPKNDEVARKITGYVALLNTKEQEDFYNDVVRRYTDLIKYLDSTGTNDLKITVMPLKAKTLSKSVSSEGKDPNGNNPFAQNAYVEEVEMDVLRKPMKADEIRKSIEQLNTLQGTEKGNVGTAAQDKAAGERVLEIAGVVEREEAAKLAAEEERHAVALQSAEAAIAKRREKLSGQQNISEEEKADKLAEYTAETMQKVNERHEANMNKIRSITYFMKEGLKRYSVGNTYILPQEGGEDGNASLFTSPAIFCGYKVKDSKLTPSTSFAVFATLDGRRRIEVKFTDNQTNSQIGFLTSSNYAQTQQVTLDNWDSHVPTNTRKKGYIMTGNILQAVSDTQDEATGAYVGQLISYTDEEGNIHDGVLMPDRWQPAMLKTSGVPILARLAQLLRGGSVTSTDGKVTITTNRYGDGELSVPKTKKEGEKYFTNETILSAISGGFWEKRGKFNADIVGEDNIRTVVTELSNMGVRVKADPSTDSELLKRRDAGKKQKADGKAAKVSAKERKLRDAVVDLLRNKAGIDVVTESEEGQRVLDMANGRERQHRVYHGSGADFERFDHSHMGEGEGAQAFGWGTYVTEVEGIGRRYARAMGQPTYQGRKYNDIRDYWNGDGDTQFVILQLLRYLEREPSRTLQEAIDFTDKVYELRIARYNGQNEDIRRRTILNSLSKDDFNTSSTLYTVEIPEDNGSNYLDWKITIPKSDRRRIADAVRGLAGEPAQSVKYANYTGGWGQLADMIERNQWAFQEVRDRLLEAFGGRIADDKKVSELMHSAGFVGIKYPADYYNGGRADNAKNYVIFNESDLQITDKVKFFRTESGEAYGFTMDGKIYLDPRIATAETPIHEYTHLWAAALRAANPKAWERLKSELEKDKDLMAYVQRLYPELKGDELMDEVFAHFSGRRGAERLRAEQERMEGETHSIVGKAKVIAMFENLRDALKKFWNAARELFAGKGVKNESAEDFADMVLADLVSGFNPRASSDVRFRGEDEPVFYSNAMRAVENIKQEKATPEQWLKMIEKNGGLKAGEDKWLGLSEWLKGSDAKTLTKGEVLDYIRANEIQVEEVEYSEDAVNPNRYFIDLANGDNEWTSLMESEVNKRYGWDSEDAWVVDYMPYEWFRFNVDNADEKLHLALKTNAKAKLVDESSYDLDDEEERELFISDIETELMHDMDSWSMEEDESENLINSTRLQYTTEGLDNKREIVLTVPTIEPWNEHDEIHFGEAGGGRAVAWVRFGETTDADGKRVLVIDEIQSKRHQEGREKGYYSAEARRAYKEYKAYLHKKYPNGYVSPSLSDEVIEANKSLFGNATRLTKEEQAKYSELQEKAGLKSSEQVPDAPFEKNWHEVAMKRMLRFAAENGYDKVAWTKGEQQAERYNLSSVVSKIEISLDYRSTEERPLYEVFTYNSANNIIDGASGMMNTERLGETFGKELAVKLAAEANKKNGEQATLSGEGLKVGGEGMKGFYDQILPRFMDKYGKRWGVKTGEVELPNIGEGGLTMWSVDVTDDMRESVMRGQPLFRPKTQSREGGEEAAQGEWYDRGSVERIGEFAGYTPKQIAKMNARQEQSARNKFRDAAEKLHLSDNITFADSIDDVPGLTDKQRKEWRRKKGWYSPRTGKIVIILGNHKSMDDVMKSILHEGVAHHGLRQMFGEHFNTFLDNVYRVASPEIRDRINTMAKKHGWDFREATEEYLAMLAEDTDFERPENQSWWKQVKEWFIDLLHKIGFKLHDAYDTITDNELRYILWRSYQNLVNPGRYNSVVEEAKDIAKQYDLKVGQWDETWTIAAEEEPNATIEYGGRRIPIWATNGRRGNRVNKGGIKPSINLNEVAEIKAEAENDGFVAGIGIDMTMTDGNVYHLWVGADKEEEDYETTDFYPQDYDDDIPNEEMTRRFGKFFGENVNKIFGSIIGGYIMTSGRRGFTLSHDEIMRMGGVRNDRMGSDYNVAADGVAEDENTQGYKEWESERQYKKAKELLTALHDAGYKDFYISRSITDFGVSTYIQGMFGAKFRLSDHSVTRFDRLVGEEHITHNTTPESAVATVKEYEKRAKERNKAFDDKREREKQLDEKWERIKPLFDGLVFKRNERTYQNFETFSSKGNRSNILQIPTTKGAFKYEWTEPKEPNDFGKDKPSYEWLEAFDEEASEVNTVRFRDGEEEESDSEERESIEQLANNMSIGTAARFAAIAARNAQESHDNAEALAAALNFTSQNLAQIVKATKAQKKFDKATVKQVTDMARVMVSAGYLDSMGRADVKGLLKAIRESTGETDNTDNVNRIIDIMVKNQLKNQENTLATLLKIKGSRVDARGINVQGKLDPNGQQVIKSFKDNMKEQRETIESRIADAEERMTSEDKAIADAAYNEKVGLQLALDYVDKIGQSKADEKDIEAKKRAELSKVYDYTRVVDVDEQGNALFKKDGTERTHEVRHVRAEYKGKISDEKKAERERVEQTAAAMDDAIRHMRMERIDAYTDFIAQVAGNMKESMRKLEERREAEKRRIEEIHHNANSDMEGRPASEHRSDTGGVLNWINNTAGGTLFAPLASFGEMLRMFGRKSPNGEGYLFNRFMRGLIDARHKELNGVHDKYSELDKKAQAVFGGKVETWADMMNAVRKGENIIVEWFDGKEMKPHTLHQGNLMYIYMVNKMSDGRMKLRHMGIDEKAMAFIESKLDPRLKEIADWLQEDFLVRSRNEYNETHKRMFGASMSAIEDYFPLVINSGSRNKDAEKEDAAENNPNTITTATGAIKKRTVNVVDLDLLNADAMHVILDHIAEMEHWNAFAEYNRDLNTLRSYKRFENQVKNMTTILGDGEQTWKAFNKTAQIAVGSYQKAQSDLDAKSLEFASKVTAAKVAFRINTALKQLLSLPAYLPYANASGFYHALANDLGNGTAPWKWCMENLPMYRERWESRVSGDPRLLKLTNDWKSQRATRLQKISRAGMLPNAAVDALTVSIGAHAVYETRKAQYLKEGYSETAAEKRAIQDAEIAYNETQQSSEGGFVSVMQVDKSWLNVLFTIFRNASMAYQRQLHGALRNLINMRTKARREQAKEFLAKQIARDGVNEAQARLAAEQRFNRTMRKNWIAVATFGYIVQFAWNFGGQMWYLLFGDDDDKKKKTWKDILIHSLFGGVEGLTGGDWLSELGRQIATGDRNPQSLNKDMPLTSDMFAIIEKFGQSREWEAVSDIINLAVQAGVGANPQTLTDAVVATIDACNGDLGLAREAALFAMRVIQVPQSQTEQIYFDEIGMTGEEARKLSYEQLVERYAKYRVKRNYFWTPWEWDNEKALEKGEKRGERIIKERMETMSDEQLEEALSNLFESSGEKGKKLSFNQYAKREGLKGYDYSDVTKNDGAKYYMNIATWRDVAEDITLHQETKRLEDEIKRLKKLGVRENEAVYWQTDDRLKDLNEAKKEIGEIKKEMVDANGNPMSEEVINTKMENIRKARRRALYPEQAANPTDNVEE